MNTETFTTKTDALDRIILPALGEWAEDHDVDAIFDEAFEFDTAAQAFYQSATEEEFWEIVERHAK